MTDSFAGKIFRVRFPFTESDGFKLRPAPALSERDEYGDIRWAFVTTRLIHSRTSLAFEDGIFREQPLSRASCLIPDKAVTIHRIRIGQYYAQPGSAFGGILKVGLLAGTRSFSQLAHTANRTLVY